MMKGWVVKLGEPGWFEDVSGSYTHGSYVWRFTEVHSIELRRTHCATCERALLRGWCVIGHSSLKSKEIHKV